VVPDVWHWDAQFQWGPFATTVSVWFVHVPPGMDMTVQLHGWTLGPSYTLMVDGAADTYSIPEAGFTGTWSEYPDDLPPAFEAAPAVRTSNPGAGDAGLARAQQKLDDTNTQISQTWSFVDAAQGRISSAVILTNQSCGPCADAAEVQLQRAGSKLIDVKAHLVAAGNQLEVAIDQIDEARLSILTGGPPVQIVSALNGAIGNMDRAGEKLDLAAALLEQAGLQVEQAVALLAPCGACANQAAQLLQDAESLLVLAAESLSLTIQMLDDAHNQVTAARDGYACPADTNGDGVVDVNDLVNVIVLWGTDGQAAGIDADVIVDGTVDVNDLVAVIVAWGDC
jgi:bacterioferritin-associated ferredoxin